MERFNFHPLAGKHEWNERDMTVEPAKALAAINKFFDFDRGVHSFSIPGGGRARRRRGGSFRKSLESVRVTARR